MSLPLLKGNCSVIPVYFNFF